MIIDETFIWLYAAFKVGRACLILALAGLLGAIGFFAIACEKHGSIKPTMTCAVFCVLCLFIAVVTPNFEEVKGYAYYRIGADAANSDVAKRLFDATMKVLEQKGK